MNTTIVLIIVIIVSIIFVLFTSCHCYKLLKPIPELGYADVEDPYDKPYILERFISESDCQKIIQEASKNLVDSVTVGGANKAVRNSQQHWISKFDPVAKPLFEKISKMYGIPFENGEDLQVVRYKPGQYYNEHHDSCCDNNDKCVSFLRRGGHRILTVLIYLNDSFEEGNTYFKNLDIKMKASPGSAIVFFPLAKNKNKCHPNALHAGMPVTSGEKWIANLWFRQNRFS